MAIANVEILARNAYLDGVRLTFQANDAVLSQNRYNGITEALAEASGWDLMEVRKYVRFNKITSGKQHRNNLDAFFIGGKLSRFFVRAGLTRYVNNITEIHAKWHLVEAYEGAHNAFIDALYSQHGKFAGTAYTPSHSPRNKRAGGTKGYTIGNPKSDTHVTVNKYRGERTGVEGHVKGKALNRIKSEEARRGRSNASGGNEEQLTQQVFAEAATRSALRFLRAVRSRGIVLTDYFVGASYVSWDKPIHEKGFDLLNAEEENNWVQLTNTGGIQLSEGEISAEYEQQGFTE